MNVFELIFSVLLVVLVVFGSNRLGQMLGLPEAVAVVPVIGAIALLLYVTRQVRGHTLMILSTRLLVVALLAIGFSHIAGLRQATFIASGCAVFVFIGIVAIQSRILAWRRRAGSNTR
jgi:hypothetical protein